MLNLKLNVVECGVECEKVHRNCQERNPYRHGYSKKEPGLGLDSLG